MSKALLVIDLQNDYFEGGAYPLWNAESTLANTEQAIAAAQAAAIPVILVQHVADPKLGPSPFFTEGTRGAALHPRVRAAAKDAPVIVKAFADSFEQTALEDTLASLGVTELVITGMMTQNCVTHTAVSNAAQKYKVSVSIDCCTTVDETIHNIALHGLSRRVALAPVGDLLGA